MWYASESPQAAKRWYHSLVQKIETLQSYPKRCPVTNEESKGTGREVRQLLHGTKQYQYRVVFEIKDKVVYVIAVRHAACDS